ncbi:hypothetical protein [Clostridium saccharobutylicum]|uniref:Uncharacterized protein n=1 Tax=Clostridium saccharobutylicum TaxID=169679 RepID=A0A1S8N622_CLOSA|nr:hypothetical protein [Clostridium saccharobutylicum]OOM11843.1 hypothetical protein CLOSAC_22700 [Clostridium saccharobutylicum]
MSEINNNDLTMDKQNKSELENEVIKESNDILKCENEKNMDVEVNNNKEAQLEGKNEQPILNVQEESNECEEKDHSDKKEEASIDSEIVKNDIESKNEDVEVNNNQEPQLQYTKEQSILNNEVLENNNEIDLEQKDESKTKKYIEIIDDDKVKEEEELNLKYDLNDYKDQIEKDIIVYERNLLNYKQWALDGKELVLNSKKTFNKIELLVEKFNKEISIKLEELNDEDKKLVENRIKGINMINKMSKNAISNRTNKLLEMINQDFNNMSIISDINNKDEDEVRSILNENYGNIAYIESKKSNLIDTYFSFIEGNLLPILDGVESGISFVKNSNKEIIQNEILLVYIELKKCFDELLFSINVSKMEVQLKTKIDFSCIDVLDIEDTEDESLDETIESVIRSGYEYLKDVYGVGHNHVLRQAQIVAYKYKK